MTVTFLTNISMNTVKVETIQTGDCYDKVLIFLHGVGGSGSEWIRFLQKIVPANTKVILPTAPTSPVTLYGGIVMNSW